MGYIRRISEDKRVKSMSDVEILGYNFCEMDGKLEIHLRIKESDEEYIFFRRALDIHLVG